MIIEDLFIACLILAALGLWTLYWAIIVFIVSNKKDEHIEEATTEGRKVSFWITPKGRPWAARILLLSIILWGSIAVFAAIHWKPAPFEILLKTACLMALGVAIILIISKIFSFGVKSKDVERTLKKIEEREKNKHKSL